MSNTEDIRKIMDRLKNSEHPVKASKKPDNMLTEHFNDDETDTMEPTTKVEIEFTGAEEAEVEVYAMGMDEVKRLVDLAGIFHKEKVGSMGIDVVDPTGAIDIPAGPVGMEPPMGMDAPMDDPMADPMGMDAPMDDPMADPVGMEPEMSPADDDYDMNYGGDDGGMDLPTGGLDVPVDGDMGMDAVPDEDPEMDFAMEPDVEGLGESGLRHDYGNPGENMGQEKFHMDAYNFAGGASKPVRAVPARSGDNPMVDPATKKGLKEYMAELVEDLEKKNLSEAPDPKTELTLQKIQNAFSDNTDNASVKRGVEDAVKDLTDEPNIAKLSAGEMAAGIEADLKDDGTEMTDPNAENVEDEVEDIDDLMDSDRNWSFKQKVLPFQGLTGSQRIHRNALRRVRQRFKK